MSNMMSFKNCLFEMIHFKSGPSVPLISHTDNCSVMLFFERKVDNCDDLLSKSEKVGFSLVNVI